MYSNPSEADQPPRDDMKTTIFGRDWSLSPLGDRATWPSQLKTLVGIILASNQPMFVAWGPKRTLIYNNAYSDILASKHPAALGEDLMDVWSDIEADLLPIVERTYSGQPVEMDDIKFIMNRRGYPEETHFSFFYAPIADDDGTVMGIYCACNEITAQVLSARRGEETEKALLAERDRTRASQAQQAFLLDLTDNLRAQPTTSSIMQLASDSLGTWLGADRVFYAEIAGSLMTVECEYAEGVISLIGQHSLEAFGPDLLSAYRSQTAIRVDDVVNDERLNDAAREGLGSRQVGSFVDVVLFKETTFVGLLAVQAKSARVWTSEEEALIREVADRMKFAVERSRADEDAFRAATRHRLRAELGQVLQSLSDPMEIKSAVARRLGPHLGVDQANYYRIEDGKFVVTNEWHADGLAGMLGVHQLGSFAKSTVRLLEAGSVLRVDDTRTQPDAEAYSTFGMGAALSVPLHRNGAWVAGLHLHQSTPRAWTDDEEDLVREVAAYIWAALERARAQQELRALNETLEQQVAERSAERDRLWSLSQDMFARADYSGMMSAVSPAWERVLGWSEAELLSRGYASFMHPDDTTPTLAAISRMAETRRPTRFENRIATSDGGWKSIEWTVAPEADGQNFVAVGRDMSLVKAKEHALVEAQEQLRQSQKLEAMGQLTGGVAHDFNNLLTPIIGSLDMLTRTELTSDRQRRLIDRALQSAERAKLLVQRLLAFARRQPLQATAVDVAALIDSMKGLIGSTLGPSINITLNVEPDLPPAKADENQLEMALLNLAVNARDAMADGGNLTIAATLEQSSGDTKLGLSAGCYLRLRVVDTGTGMDEATIARAIEPFFSTKGIGKGTGLGLSMVHGLTAQLGGALDIVSAPGQGTSVELWLPVSEGYVDLKPDAEPSFAPSAKRGTALLVDDEPLVRMNTSDMLVDLGYIVIEAASAEEALLLVQNGAIPDVLITDHLMPGMTGAELARDIRRTKPDLPVVIVSGYSEVEGLAPDLPRLTKPFRHAELADILTGLMPAVAVEGIGSA